MATTGTITWLAPAPAARVRTRRVLPSLSAMWHALVTRRMLAEMDDHMLADIGVSRSDAWLESTRKPWDCGNR